MSFIPLTDLTHVIRSKNSSPFEITLDIIFKEEVHYESLKKQQFFSLDFIAQLYQFPRSAIQSIVYFDPAQAIKINYKRNLVSGSPGDSDVYGAQQHAPLLGVTIPSHLFD